MNSLSDAPTDEDRDLNAIDIAPHHRSKTPARTTEIMALKDRFRRALRISASDGTQATTRDSSTSESNSSGDGPTLQSRSESPQPSTPVITLTKTTSRLGKKLTGRSEKDEEERERRRKEKEWEAFAPRKYLFLKSSKEREAMTGFEWKWRNSSEG